MTFSGCGSYHKDTCNYDINSWEFVYTDIMAFLN